MIRLLKSVLLVFSPLTFFCASVDAQQIASDFQLPLANYISVINQRFGEENPDFTDNNGDPKQHVADDVNGIAGITTVIAVANGRVMFSRIWGFDAEGNCPDWGHVLVIEHILPDGGRVNSIYGHLDPNNLLVNEGDIVVIGQPLGKVGHWTEPRTGALCWGDHLHFGIRNGEFGVPIGVYPSWLAGYLPKNKFPTTYCEPITFVRDMVCAFFDFAVGFLAIDGNIIGSGNSNNIFDFFDNFNDGSLMSLPTSSFDFSQGVAATNESGGFLNFRSVDGAFILGDFLLDDAKLTHLFTDGSGSSEIFASFRADSTSFDSFYCLGIESQSLTEDNTHICVTGTPSGGVIVFASDETNIDFATFPINPTSAAGGQILLRLVINDNSNRVTPSFSLNGGATFINFPSSGDIFNTDTQYFVFLQGSDRF